MIFIGKKGTKTDEVFSSKRKFNWLQTTQKYNKNGHPEFLLRSRLEDLIDLMWSFGQQRRTMNQGSSVQSLGYKKNTKNEGVSTSWSDSVNLHQFTSDSNFMQWSLSNIIKLGSIKVSSDSNHPIGRDHWALSLDPNKFVSPKKIYMVFLGCTPKFHWFYMVLLPSIFPNGKVWHKIAGPWRDTHRSPRVTK